MDGRMKRTASETSRTVRAPLISVLVRDGADLVVLLVVPVVHSRSSVTGGLRPAKHRHTHRQWSQTHLMRRKGKDRTIRANGTLRRKSISRRMENGWRSDATNRKQTNRTDTRTKTSSCIRRSPDSSSSRIRIWGTIEKVAVGVTAIKQQQAIVHFHVFREHIVQEQQLTLIQSAVSLVEDADGGGHGRQPSPATQEGANLPEVLEHQNIKQGTAMQP